MIEKNKRLPLDRNGLEREWTPGERYQFFRRGFRDGAGSKTMNPDYEGLGAYDRGYAEGIEVPESIFDYLKKYDKAKALI